MITNQHLIDLNSKQERTTFLQKSWLLAILKFLKKIVRCTVYVEVAEFTLNMNLCFAKFAS